MLTAKLIKMGAVVDAKDKLIAAWSLLVVL
jgi:hypothetical protein